MNETRCPVCGSASLAFLGARGDYRFDRCGDCGYAFLNPRPQQSFLDSLYHEERTAPEPTFDKAGSRLRRAWFKLPRFFPYAFRKDVLDLGCGGGFTAQVLGHIARSATGIDINRNAIAYAQSRFGRARYLCAGLEAVAGMPDRYDFIHSSEMIEHVADVNAYVRTLGRLCRPGGCVYITTPDLGHPKVPARAEDWDVFCPPVHVQFFTRRAATILFERHGFEVLRFYGNAKPGLLMLARRTGAARDGGTTS